MFHLHPSPDLREAFARKPFQGQAPELAKYIFVGLDANYAEDVERSAVWPDLLDYLEDGVRFWRERGVHHPFLLPEYRGDGRRYHRTFSSIGFRPEHADEVCFVELVHVPSDARTSMLGTSTGTTYGGSARRSRPDGPGTSSYPPPSGSS